MTKRTKVVGVSLQISTIEELEKMRDGRQHVISKFVNEAIREKLEREVHVRS